MNKRKLQSLFNPIPQNLSKPNPIFYGTAGYRSSNISDLSRALCRTSLVAAIRSSTFASKFIGLIITASHNNAEDNGVKVVDHNGESFDENWEKNCDEIVNCENQFLYSNLNKIHRKNEQMKEWGEGC